MNMLKNTVFFLLIINNLSLSGQQGNSRFCIDAEPLCGASTFSYANTSGTNSAEPGPDYGCLILQKNPSWFYLQIAQDGDIQLQIEQRTALGGIPDLDVDFVVYGPFNDPTSACVSELTFANIVDCSRRIDLVEFVDITNTKAGEYYLLLITNFTGKPGFITVTQISGAATTNCNLLNTPITSNIDACEGTTEPINATTINAKQYNWYEDDGAGIFTPITGEHMATLNVSTSNIYKAEVLDANNVVLELFEFNVVFYETVDFSLPLQPYIICDTIMPNDGFAEFDLSIMDSQVLNIADPNDFLVTYYHSFNAANSGTDPLPILYTNTSMSQDIFVRVENLTTTAITCYTVGSFKIEVNKLPKFTIEDTYILCVNTNGTEDMPTPTIIDTGLNMMDYSFVWRLNGTVLPLETSSYLYPVEEGDYAVEATYITTGCSNTADTYVFTSTPPEVTAEVVSLAFTEENNIVVTASGIGIQDHEFSLDDGVWQNDSVFKNVSIGEHAITVRNTSGCGQTTITITVMDYPLYFTPNNDGLHDTWNIVGLKNQPQAKVYIYNRYGKLLKQLSPTSIGWDGTFKGLSMPTNDYWFTVEYQEPRDGNLKQFKAHFTLKR